MNLSTFSPKAFLESVAGSLESVVASPTSVAALDGLGCSTKKLGQMFTFNSVASPTEKEISACDDVPLIEGVDHLVAGKTDKQACALLRRMVVDLMHEVDDYRGRLEEKEKRVTTLEEERFATNQEACDRLYALMLALEKITGEDVRVKLEPGTILSTEEATNLVISELTKKIGNLNMENTGLLERVDEMKETMDDLESENGSSLYKIEALEMQFKSINKTRQKVVSRLVDRSKDSTANSSPTAHGRYLEPN
jgi:polyhydroxyalkanoate synthesis regulator phasin